MKHPLFQHISHDFYKIQVKQLNEMCYSFYMIFFFKDYRIIDFRASVVTRIIIFL